MNTKVIDLSLPLYSGMRVYPGDPEVSIELIQTIETDDWNLRQINISSHIGTHVNVPAHCVMDGKTLDDYALESFMGQAQLYREDMKVQADTGIIFHDHNIDQKVAEWIIQKAPPFVGLSCAYEIDEDIERDILAAGIILYEKLTNTEYLSETFMFYGVPLRIKNGDGCPVRAFAMVKED